MDTILSFESKAKEGMYSSSSCLNSDEQQHFIGNVKKLFRGEKN